MAMGLAASALASEKPSRIVSLNLCTDELAVRLADPDRIRSVTWLAQNRQGSNVADLAAGFVANRGLAEEVIAADPDMVLAGQYTTRTTVGLLKKTGFMPHELSVPVTLSIAKDHIREVGRLVGEEAHAEAMVADIEHRMTGLRIPVTPQSPTAIVYRTNGFTTGRGSLVDDILTYAGLRNLAAEKGWENFGQVPLEVIAMTPPDYIILDGEPRQTPALAYEVLHHPVLRHLPDTKLLYVPTRLWSCAGPEMVTAIEILAATVRQRGMGRQ